LVLFTRLYKDEQTTKHKNQDSVSVPRNDTHTHTHIYMHVSSLGCVSFESDRSRSYILGISPSSVISTKYSSLSIHHLLPTFFWQ